MNIKKIAMILILSTFSGIVIADQERERYRLALIAEQIDELLRESLSISTEDSELAYPRMNFKQLDKELKLIQSGINNYIQRKLDTAREIHPITGEYVIREKVNG